MMDDTKQLFSALEAEQATRKYFNDDALATDAWMNKYAWRTPEGAFVELTPDDTHHRMAREFARVEAGYEASRTARHEEIQDKLSDYGRIRQPLTEERIYSLFEGFSRVVPQGSVMASLGKDGSLSSLSNCVVVPSPFDSYGGIMYTDQQLAQLFKRRCGAGTEVSTLRPADAQVSNSAGTTSGAVSYLQRFSNTTAEVAQKGRRGALMVSMDIAHPDVDKFIVAKQKSGKISHVNLSVRLSDKFMRAVVEDGEYTHRWPIDSDSPEVTVTRRAKEVWDSIIQCAWSSGEPGVLFWDRHHNYSTSSVYPGHENVSTNPCAEIAMPAGESCRLLALNIFGFVEKPFTAEARFDYKGFQSAVYESQHLLDDLVDLELEAIDGIREKIASDSEPDYIKEVELKTWDMLYNMGKSARRTGLGFTALADVLAALGHKFDSDEALGEVEKIMRTKCEAEFNSSIDMALERGTFDDFDVEVEAKSEFVKMLETEFPSVYERMMQHGRRNISLSTLAPCGSVSLETQTSSGGEPVFAVNYTRRRKISPDEKDVEIVFTDESGDSWMEYNTVHPKFRLWQEVTGKTDVEESPYHGSTAHEIDWLRRVEMQAMIQKYTTHSVSSTVNLPTNATIEEVNAIYLEAWRRGLKGLTVYREGSRTGVLVTNEEPKIELVQKNVQPHPVLDVKAQTLKYRVRREANQDSLHIIAASDLYVNDVDGKAFFLPDEDFQIRAPLGAATSVSFAQSGMDRTEILRGNNPDYAEFVFRLQSATSSEEEGIGPRRIKSLEHAVGLVFEDCLTRNGVIGRDATGKLVNNVMKVDLRKVEVGSSEYKMILAQVRVGDGEEIEISGNNGMQAMKDCPKCGAALTFEEGCVKCIACSTFNKCG